MKYLFAILFLSVIVLTSCFSVKEAIVDLSLMKLEKFDTVSRFPDAEIIYTWHVLDGQRRGELFYSYGKLNGPYKPGDIAYVFVRR